MRRLVLACLVLACGAPQKPATSEPPLGVKTYAPLGIKSDAKAPNQAVILGTDAKDGSTIIALPGAPGRADVDAMMLDGTSPIHVATAPSRDGSIEVGSETPGGAAPAGVWMAAFVAASTLDKDVTDVTFTATGAATSDVAASSLIAAGFLATMTGAAVDPSVTTMGIIYPDGSIGPIDGIAERAVAAIERGKKRIGYPTGMRYAKRAKSGETVDLVAVAKQHGAEAVEIADVRAAYTLLTGKTLPAPVPVPDADMTFDAATKQTLDGAYKQWQQRLAAQWGAILQLESAGRLPALLVFLRDTAKRYALTAERMHANGKVAAAYARMLTAAVYATSANQIYDVLASVQTNKLDRAMAALDKLDALEQQTTDALTKIGALRPSTLGEHLQMIGGFRAALRAYVFDDFATLALASTKQYLTSLAGTPAAVLGSEDTAAAVVAQVGPTILYIATTTAEATRAVEHLELTTPNDVGYTGSIADLQRLATSLQTAGAAGVAHVDAQLVEPYAQRAKLSADDARVAVALHEPDYLVARMMSKLGSPDGMPQRLKEAWGEQSLPWALLSLTAGELAYVDAADLIAKYDSLRVPLDEARDVRPIAHEKALAAMLATAERNARANARAARVATGAIPIQAKIAYQLGTVAKTGPRADKLDALAQFWSSSAYSQTAVMLARN